MADGTSQQDGDGTPPVRGLQQVKDTQKAMGRGLPPVHLWNPPYRGDLTIVIHRDGHWSYEGTPIERKAIVRLFSTILRLEEDGRYYLVTPVEKIGITVEDAPFLAVGMTVEGEGEDQVLTFETSVGDAVIASAGDPIRFETNETTGEPAPYVHVRRGLEALINRAVYYDLAELCVEREVRGVPTLGVWSAGAFFPFMPAGDVRT